MEDYPVSITIHINGIAGGQIGTLTTAVEMPEADGERLLGYILGVFGTDPEGTPRTPPQAIDAFIARFWSETAFRVHEWEREQAAKAAVNAVTELEYRAKSGAEAAPDPAA